MSQSYEDSKGLTSNVEDVKGVENTITFVDYVCMYVLCVYVCNMCVHVCVYVHVYICIYVYMYMHVHIIYILYVCVCMYVLYIHVYVCVVVESDYLLYLVILRSYNWVCSWPSSLAAGTPCGRWDPNCYRQSLCWRCVWLTVLLSWVVLYPPILFTLNVVQVWLRAPTFNGITNVTLYSPLTI